MTLAYFQLLQAVKESDFLNADVLSNAVAANALDQPTPTFATLRRVAGHRWMSVGRGVGQHAAPILQQVVVSLDADHSLQADSAAGGNADGFDQHPALLRHLASFHEALKTDVGVAGDLLHWDPDLCYRPADSTACFSTSFQNASFYIDPAYYINERTTVLTYVFAPQTEEAHAEWLSRLHQPSELTTLSYATTSSEDTAVERGIVFTPSLLRGPATALATATLGDDKPAPSRAPAQGLGISFPFAPSSGALGQADRKPIIDAKTNLREMRSVRWMVYALKAFVLRFYDLAKVRGSLLHLCTQS